MKQSFIKKKLNSISKFTSYEDDYELVKSYSIDWRKRFSNIAFGIIFPKSSKEISQIVKLSNKYNLKLVPQGGNTGLVGGTSPSKNKIEIIINLSKMNKILEIDKNTQTIELQSGVIAENAIKELEKLNYIFPIEMSSIGSSQIGGIIATNAGGMNVVKYGLVRNNILELEVVMASGEIMNVGSNLIKDNTGYNLKDIFCGSEGTLAIITKARIKIFPKPVDDLTMFISLRSIKDVIKSLEYINKNYFYKIERIELISDYSFELCLKHNLIKKRFFQKKTEYYLLIKFIYFNSSEKNLENFENLFLNLENNIEDILIAQNEKQSTDFWKFREQLTEAQKIEGKLIGFDLSIPINKLEQFLYKSKKMIRKILPGINFHIFGHMGDSNIHFNLIEPIKFKKDFYSYEGKIKKIINELILEFKGSISAEHGIGMLKRSEFKETKNLKEIKLMKKIKKLLDPKNIFNPNKIF